MSREEKIINEFMKLLTGLGKDTAESKKNTKQLIALTKEQLSAIRELAGGFEDSQTEFKAVETPKVFESKSAEDKFEKEMLKKQEEQAEMTDEQLIALQNGQDDIGETIDEGNNILDDIKKKNEETEKDKKKDKKKINRRWAVYFEKTERTFKSGFKDIQSSMQGFSEIIDMLGLSPIVGFISSIHNFLKVVVWGFFKNFYKLSKGIMKMLGSPIFHEDPRKQKKKDLAKKRKEDAKKKSLSEREAQESQRVSKEKTDKNVANILSNIEENTEKDKKMLKGGSLGDFFKKMKSFLPAGMFTKGTGGVGGKMGGMLSKMLGAGLILGGVVWMATDFIDGFQKGGMKQGISQALLGKTDGAISSAFKNAGKWALIGAGIGTFVAPVIGTIAGGLIGASVGLLLNYVGSLVKSDASAGKKIGDFFLGGNGGVISSLFNGAKYASMGALIGTAFAPGIGTIAGGAIGFVVGFLVNFVKQILPDSVKSVIKKIGAWFYDTFMAGWDATLSGLQTTGSTIKNIITTGFGWYMKGWSLIGDAISWVGEKIYGLAEWLGVNQYIDKAGEMISEGWNSLKDSFNKIIEWITGVGEALWDSFKTVLGDYWDAVKKWWSGGEDADKDKQGTSKPVRAKTAPQMPFGGVAPVSTKESVSNQSEIKEKETSFVESAVSSSVSNETVANETPVINENLVEGNSFSEMIAKNLRNIREFMKGDMLASLEQFLVKQVEDTIAGMRILQQEQRMYDYAMETGSLKGYASKTQEYAQELKKLDKGKAEGYTGMKNAMTQVNQNQNSVTNNIIATRAEDTLRKK